MKIFTVSALAALVTAGAAGLAPQSEAATSIRIYFGVPHYSYQVGPDYVYRPAYGWYRVQKGLNKLSCSQARAKVARSYAAVSTRDCTGRTYVFSARKNGKRVIVYVNARTGGIWRG